MGLTNEDKAWLAERLDRTDERLDHTNERLDSFFRYVLEFRTEAIQRFDYLDQRSEYFVTTVHNIDARFMPMNKAILDFGNTGAQMLREQSRQKEANANLADRVARLEEQLAKLLKSAA